MCKIVDEVAATTRAAELAVAEAARKAAEEAAPKAGAEEAAAKGVCDAAVAKVAAEPTDLVQTQATEKTAERSVLMSRHEPEDTLNMVWSFMLSGSSIHSTESLPFLAMPAKPQAVRALAWNTAARRLDEFSGWMHVRADGVFHVGHWRWVVVNGGVVSLWKDEEKYKTSKGSPDKNHLETICLRPGSSSFFERARICRGNMASAIVQKSRIGGKAIARWTVAKNDHDALSKWDASLRVRRLDSVDLCSVSSSWPIFRYRSCPLGR